VGYFGPLIEPVKNTCDRLCVFERRPFEQDFIYSDWVAPQLLPTCDKVIISGTAVINKTIDHLLSRCRGTVALLGPSTPLSPILEGHGVDFLFGSTVTDPEQVLKIIGEGGGTRSFAETVNKVNLDLSRRSPDK
ncbi:hypothetical protein K9M06_06465, partial [Candidatus Bipolaricaulota bacterium]|nr:hypothetical protein [Candidatus Bipolaricaulota bacterium]